MLSINSSVRTPSYHILSRFPSVVGPTSPYKFNRLPELEANGKVLRRGCLETQSDDADYMFLQLKNGLSVMLVSDATVDKSAAAMSVRVGHMADPRGLPGLSHFLEHMLFYSSARYPEEGGYNRWLQEHGGSGNASTSAEATTYHFEVHHAHLASTLDRFSQFFIAPLITNEGSSREANAVDSENAKNINDDGRRDLQIRKHSVNPTHNYSKFGTGNATTLVTEPAAAGVDVHAALLQHYLSTTSPAYGVTWWGGSPSRLSSRG